MKQDLLDAAIACIRLGMCGDEDAIGSVALFVPGLEEAAFDGDLIAAYFLALVYEIGVGVDEDHARAYALIRWSYDHGGASVIDQYGDHLRQWVEQWDAGISGNERERALCLLGQFRDARSTALQGSTSG
jgi:TPR repeat protein